MAHSRKIPQPKGHKMAPKAAERKMSSLMNHKVSQTQASKEKNTRKIKKF